MTSAEVLETSVTIALLNNSSSWEVTYLNNQIPSKHVTLRLKSFSIFANSLVLNCFQSFSIKGKHTIIGFISVSAFFFLF